MFTGAANSQDFVVPKGVMIGFPITAGVRGDEGIDFGYVQEAKGKKTEEKIERWTARDHSKAKIIDKPSKTTYQVSATVLSANDDNFAALLRAVKTTKTQTAGSYIDGAELAISAPATLNRAKLLGVRNVSIQMLLYKEQSGAFARGETVTGAGGASGEVAWDDDDGTTGTLYLVNVTGTFVNGEALTGDVAGAAKADGTQSTVNDIVLTDSAGTTRYTKDTDYGIHLKSGMVFFYSAGTITASASLKARFDYAEITSDVEIQEGASGVPDFWELHILSEPDAAENNYEWVAFKASIKVDTEITMITEAENPVELAMTWDLLTEGPNATDENPVWSLRKVA